MLGKRTRRATANNQHADDIVPTRQRRHHPRAAASTQDDLGKDGGRLLPQVGDLNWLALGESWRDVRIVKADVPLRKGVNQALIHSVSSAQAKFICLLIIAVDGASLGTRELH